MTLKLTVLEEKTNFSPFHFDGEHSIAEAFLNIQIHEEHMMWWYPKENSDLDILFKKVKQYHKTATWAPVDFPHNDKDDYIGHKALPNVSC